MCWWQWRLILRVWCGSGIERSCREIEGSVRLSGLVLDDRILGYFTPTQSVCMKKINTTFRVTSWHIYLRVIWSQVNITNAGSTANQTCPLQSDNDCRLQKLKRENGGPCRRNIPPALLKACLEVSKTCANNLVEYLVEVIGCEVALFGSWTVRLLIVQL